MSEASEYVANCAHDDVCDHGRSLDWACAPCGRELPDGMEVCVCGEPAHHARHRPSKWFTWHSFTPPATGAEPPTTPSDRTP